MSNTLGRCLVILFLGSALMAQTHATSVFRPRKPLVANTTLEWRKTRNGWEQIYVCDPDLPTQAAPADRLIIKIHPATLAVLQLLISIGALAAFATERELMRLFGDPVLSCQHRFKAFLGKGLRNQIWTDHRPTQE